MSLSHRLHRVTWRQGLVAFWVVGALLWASVLPAAQAWRSWVDPVGSAAVCGIGGQGSDKARPTHCLKCLPGAQTPLMAGGGRWPGLPWLGLIGRVRPPAALSPPTLARHDWRARGPPSLS